jgi:hypothetical protein
MASPRPRNVGGVVVEWRDLALAVLSGLWVVLSGVATAIWAQVLRNRDSLSNFERHVSETYVRRDHSDSQFTQLMTEIRSLRELVITVIQQRRPGE